MPLCYAPILHVSPGAIKKILPLLQLTNFSFQSNEIVIFSYCLLYATIYYYSHFIHPLLPFSLHLSYCIVSHCTTSSFAPLFPLPPFLPLSFLGSLVIDTYKLPSSEAIVCDPSLSLSSPVRRPFCHLITANPAPAPCCCIFNGPASPLSKLVSVLARALSSGMAFPSFFFLSLFTCLRFIRLRHPTAAHMLLLDVSRRN